MNFILHIFFKLDLLKIIVIHDNLEVFLTLIEKIEHFMFDINNFIDEYIAENGIQKRQMICLTQNLLNDNKTV